MKKLFLMATMLLTFVAVNAQNVKQKDRYGSSVVYVDGSTLKANDRYGDALYYNDGQTIRRKDRYGQPQRHQEKDLQSHALSP